MCVYLIPYCIYICISDVYMYMRINVLGEVIFKPLVCVHVSLSLMDRMLVTEMSNGACTCVLIRNTNQYIFNKKLFLKKNRLIFLT